MSSRFGQAAVSALLLGALWVMPTAAQSLFARHTVTVQLATSDGKPMADAEVKVFAPGQPNRPVLTGRTDKNGKFEFPADQDGFWSAEAKSGSEVARVTVRVGGAGRDETLSPSWLIGGLFLLLVLAFAYRVMRIRRRPPPPG